MSQSETAARLVHPLAIESTGPQDVSKSLFVCTKTLALTYFRTYNCAVEIEFDPSKSEANAASRGLPFSLVAGFDWTTALMIADTRHAYPEPRFLAHGRIGDRLHAVVFTPTAKGVRVISFRKANAREIKRYAQARP
jgi:uncharacterized protein